jgi:hypothetical protein
MDLSSEAETSSFDADLELSITTVTSLTGPVCLDNVRTHFPDDTSQILMVESRDPDANLLTLSAATEDTVSL